MRIIIAFLWITCLLQTYAQKTDSNPALTVKKLKNATYSPSPNESLFEKNTKLSKGIHYYPNEDGIIDSAAFTELNDKMIAFGDLNNDGIDDAAVILGTSGGGSGYFMDLVAVYNINGEPQSAASIGIGDRTIVKQISIKNGIIELKMLSHGKEDGQCCPSKKTNPKFIIKGDKLVELTGIGYY